MWRAPNWMSIRFCFVIFVREKVFFYYFSNSKSNIPGVSARSYFGADVHDLLHLLLEHFLFRSNLLSASELLSLFFSLSWVVVCRWARVREELQQHFNNLIKTTSETLFSHCHPASSLLLLQAGTCEPFLPLWFFFCLQITLFFSFAAPSPASLTPAVPNPPCQPVLLFILFFVTPLSIPPGSTPLNHIFRQIYWLHVLSSWGFISS